MAKAGKPKGYPHTGGNLGTTPFWRPRWDIGVCIIFDRETADFKAWLAGNMSICCHGTTRLEALKKIEEVLCVLLSGEEANSI